MEIKKHLSEFSLCYRRLIFTKFYHLQEIETFSELNHHKLTSRLSGKHNRQVTILGRATRIKRITMSATENGVQESTGDLFLLSSEI